MRILSSLFRKPEIAIVPKITFLDSKNGLAARIETNRLVLNSVRLQDLQNYQKLFSEKKTVRLYADGKPHSKERVEERLKMWIARWKTDPFSAFAVSSKKTGEFIGHAVLGHGDKPGQSEAALLLHRHTWNKGYGTEASMALKAYAIFLRDQGYLLEGKPLTEVTATSRVDNHWMNHILEKVGMKSTHTSEKWGSLRNHYSMQLPPQEKTTLSTNLVPHKTENKGTSFRLTSIYDLFVKATDEIADTLRISTNQVFNLFRSSSC